MTVAGIVLAAGAGRRFAVSGATEPKARAEIGGAPLVVRALRAALGGGLDEVVLVHGAIDLADLIPPGVTLLSNPRWEEGLATSVQVGLTRARQGGHDAVVVGLADQPGVTADTWRRLASAPVDPPIAVATYEGQRGNPVRLHQSVWPLVPPTGDEGARSLMVERPELVQEVSCGGDPHDVDTLDDLPRWT